MKHHGTVATATTLPAAYDGARQLDWLCDVWLRASAVGTPALLSVEQVDEIVERMPDHGRHRGR